ncbi:hypothetical protein BDV93DRAFT_515701 [Ceratobasidium sp. AG-I]|nr:hypothetical protein BDV93DRAFT_515701 [Ceratobasidium sp. AG-I]
MSKMTEEEFFAFALAKDTVAHTVYKMDCTAGRVCPTNHAHPTCLVNPAGHNHATGHNCWTRMNHVHSAGSTHPTEPTHPPTQTGPANKANPIHSSPPLIDSPPPARSLHPDCKSYLAYGTGSPHHVNQFYYCASDVLITLRPDFQLHVAHAAQQLLRDGFDHLLMWLMDLVQHFPGLWTSIARVEQTASDDPTSKKLCCILYVSLKQIRALAGVLGPFQRISGGLWAKKN